MIKFGELDLKDFKITDALASVANGKKIAVGSEVIWKKNASPLPSGYTEVKYLMARGNNTSSLSADCWNNQYIDTEYFINNNVGCEFKFAFTHLKYYSYLTGARNQDVFSFRPIYVEGDGNIVYLKDSSGQNYQIEQFNNNEHIVSFNVINGEMTYDGTVLDTNLVVGSDNTRSIYIFGINQGSTDKNKRIGSPCKIYYYKLYDNGILVRNFIPCLDENNVACFYDTITERPFYNSGTGYFGYETMDGTVVVRW